MKRCLERAAVSAQCVGLLCASLLGGFGCEKKQPVAEPAKAEQAAAATAEKQFGLTPEQAKQTLVKIDGTTITLGEFAERLGNQSPYLRARYNSPERRREFLDNMVRFELLWVEAKKRGFDKNEEVARTRKQMMVQQMMQDLFDKDGLKLSDISDAEIKQYYDANRSEFEKPAQVRASQILVRDRATADKLLSQLKAAGAIDDMELFRRLAQQHNQDPATKASAGDLLYFSAEKDAGESTAITRPEAVRKAAFSLGTIGQVYPDVIQTELGFHVLKLTGKREAVTRSLEDARRLIQNRLWREKREQAIEKFVAELRSKANLKENPELLAKVQVKVDEPGQKHDDGARTGDKASTKPAPAEKRAE